MLVQSLRGGVVELVHRVSLAVVDNNGKRVAWTGDPGLRTFMRSAAKPFQAIPLVADGVMERYAITTEELALACASHNSEPRQVSVVRGLLAKIGCEEGALVCGPHRPLFRDFAVREPDAPRPHEVLPRSSLTSNCSGKHTGMLALAAHRGWPLSGYEQSDHPVQRRCKTEVARWCDVAVASIGEGVDGCGVVSFHVPLDAMALAFARLGASNEATAVAVRSAMMGHPDLIAGQDRLCTALMTLYPGEVLAKVGAAGVYGVALPKRGLGLALKLEDGHARATMAALLAVLEQLGLNPSPRSALPRFAEFPVLNTLGNRVGTLRASGQVTFD